jgi:hypothetical protein
MRSGKGQGAAALQEADLRAEAGLPWMAHAVAVLPQMVAMAVPRTGLFAEARKVRRHQDVAHRRLLVRKPIYFRRRCVSETGW